MILNTIQILRGWLLRTIPYRMEMILLHVCVVTFENVLMTITLQCKNMKSYTCAKTGIKKSGFRQI